MTGKGCAFQRRKTPGAVGPRQHSLTPGKRLKTRRNRPPGATRRGLGLHPSYGAARQDVSRPESGRLQEFVSFGNSQFGFSLAVLPTYLAKNRERLKIGPRQGHKLAPEAA